MSTFVSKIASAIAQELETLTHKKVRLLAALLISAVLFACSCYFSGEVYLKRYLMFALLSLVTGFMAAFPLPFSKYLSIPFTFCYLCAVPLFTFRRIELPLHDMENITRSAEVINILMILFVFAVLLLVFQRVHLALGIGETVLMILALVNYYVYTFRGRGFGYGDIKAIGTGIRVMGNYALTMTPELWYSILYFLCFIFSGFRCRIPLRGKKYHAAITGVSLVYLIFFLFTWKGGKYMKEHELESYYWCWDENGFLATFASSIVDRSMEKPFGYSETALKKIVEEVEEDAEKEIEKGTDVNKPNIIFVMNEAWADLRILGNLETSEPFMPFYDSLSENVMKGSVYVNIQGGVTAQSEYEALMGDSLAFLGSGAVPYEMQIDHEVYSLARAMKEQGYQTIAMHPNAGASWNRDNVYRYMGFDELVFLNQFATEYEMIQNYVSDKSNFDEIIYRFENRNPNQPLFLFDVTIQNHADYYFQVDTPITVQKIGETETANVQYTYDDIWTYVNMMRVTDEALEDLITYFSQVEEPTIICMFGDHQPNLRSSFYQAMFAASGLTEEEQIMLTHMTPYFIWSNYENEFEELGNMSANYLGISLMECAGLALSPYYKLVKRVQEKYPVLTNRGCLNRENAVCYVTDIWNDDIIVDYRMMQYNHLMEKEYMEELFRVSGP